MRKPWMRESLARLTPHSPPTRSAPNTPSNTTSRLHPPIGSAAGTKAQWAGKWSIGSMRWIESGARCRFGDLRVETNADHHVFDVEISLE